MSEKKPKKRGFWFTSLMIGTAVASVAGAVYIAKDKEKGGKLKAINKLVTDVANDGKTIYKSFTVDNIKQIHKITDIIKNIFVNTWEKLNIINYFAKKDHKEDIAKKDEKENLVKIDNKNDDIMDVNDIIKDEGK